MSTVPPASAQPPVAPSGMDHDALPPGTRFGEFEILRVVGVGGFGIVYLAHDHSLEREVALKEYMPASLAARGHGPQITVRSSSFAETYAIGLRSFINEARLLARFDHPSLVKVYRFWEDNATAYMVMPFLQGVTLRDTRRAMAHPPNEAWVRSVIAPILSALELLHREGVYHRDIAPDNILLPPDGPPVLLDFGAARRVIGDRTQSLTAILKPSYAPIEQYAEMVQMRQGPWTDLYALGAVIHYLMFGTPPAPATARAVQDEGDGVESRTLPGVSPRFLEAVSWMLAIRPNQRPQSGEELRAVLDGQAEIPPRGRLGTTIPGALAPAPGAAPLEATRHAEHGTDPSQRRTAHLPTHLPTAHVAPAGAPRAATFSPTAQMPTARADASQLDGRRAAPAAAAVAARLSGTALQPARDGGAASRPATLPPGQGVRRPSAPSTRPAALAAAPARAAAATRRRSPAPMLVIAAAVAAVAIVLVAGWQFLTDRDEAAAAAAAGAATATAASAPVVATPTTTTPPPPTPTPTPTTTPTALAVPASLPASTTLPTATAAATAPALLPPGVAQSPGLLPGSSTPGAAAPLSPLAGAAATTSARMAPASGPALGDAGRGFSGADRGPSASAASGARGRSASRPGRDSDPSTASLNGAPARPGESGAPARPGESGPFGGANVVPIYGTPATVDRPRATAPTSGRDGAVAGQRPTPPVDAGPTSASEACAKRVFVSLAICMDEKCEEPAWRHTQECIGILARKTARENR